MKTLFPANVRFSDKPLVNKLEPSFLVKCISLMQDISLYIKKVHSIAIRPSPFVPLLFSLVGGHFQEESTFLISTYTFTKFDFFDLILADF